MKILSNSVRETLNIGKAMAKKLKAGHILCLFGKLGSGKTVLTKGVARGLGIKKERVISPTFVLIREYHTKVPLYHFDLYRLKGPRNLLGLGYEEYFYGTGITVIEWADRMKYILPEEYLEIRLFTKSDKQRLIEFKAHGRTYQRLLKDINENIRY